MVQEGLLCYSYHVHELFLAVCLGSYNFIFWLMFCNLFVCLVQVFYCFMTGMCCLCTGLLRGICTASAFIIPSSEAWEGYSNRRVCVLVCLSVCSSINIISREHFPIEIVQVGQNCT